MNLNDALKALAVYCEENGFGSVMASSKGGVVFLVEDVTKTRVDDMNENARLKELLKSINKLSERGF